RCASPKAALITAPRQRHFHHQQSQNPDGEGGDQLPVQLSVSQPNLDKLTDALDRALDDDNVRRRLVDIGGNIPGKAKRGQQPPAQPSTCQQPNVEAHHNNLRSDILRCFFLTSRCRAQSLRPISSTSCLRSGRNSARCSRCSALA